MLHTVGYSIRRAVARELHRRHESQRAMVAAKIANLGEGRPDKTAPIGAVSQDDTGELLHRSKRERERMGRQNTKLLL